MSKTLEKNTTHIKLIFGKMVQGVHSDTTRTKIVQKETIPAPIEIIGQLPV